MLGFEFILLIFETLPQSQLEREINFGRRSVVELITMLAGSLTALTLARAGFGAWTLVWVSLTTAAIRMLGLNLVQRSLCRPRFSLKGMKADLLFGRSATVDRVIRFALADTDRLIGGKLFGNVLLGYYAVASDLASMPINKLTGLINSIALPAFAKAQSHPRGAGASMLALTRFMSLLAFPFFFGMSSLAAELTALFLGLKWHAVAVPLQLLGIVMPLRMLTNVLQPLLWGIGRPDRSVSTFLIGGLTMPAAFFVGAHWGPTGLSAAWLLVYPLVFLFSVAHAQPQTRLSLMDFLRAIRWPALASLVMYAAVLAAKHSALTGRMGTAVHLAQLILVGAVTYTGSMLALDRNLLRDALDLLRVFLGPSSTATGVARLISQNEGSSPD